MSSTRFFVTWWEPRWWPWNLMMPQSSTLHIFITGKLLCQLLLSASSLSCISQQNYVAMEIIVFVFDVGHKQGLDLVCSHSYNIIMADIQSSVDMFISNISTIVRATKVHQLHFSMSVSSTFFFQNMTKSSTHHKMPCILKQIKCCEQLTTCHVSISHEFHPSLLYFNVCNFLQALWIKIQGKMLPRSVTRIQDALCFSIPSAGDCSQCSGGNLKALPQTMSKAMSSVQKPSYMAGQASQDKSISRRNWVEINCHTCTWHWLLTTSSRESTAATDVSLLCL